MSTKELERGPRGPEPLYQRLFSTSGPVPVAHSELKSLAEENAGTEIINSKTIDTKFGAGRQIRC